MPRWRYLRILDTERSEVSNFLRYRHRGHLTDLDLQQLINYANCHSLRHCCHRYIKLSLLRHCCHNYGVKV